MRYKRKKKHIKKQKNSTEETRNEYRKYEKAAKKAVAGAMKREAVRRINELSINASNVFRLVRKMKIKSTDVVGRRCMLGNNGTLMKIEQSSGRHIYQNYE